MNHHFRHLFDQTSVHNKAVNPPTAPLILAGYGYRLDLGGYVLLDDRSVMPTRRQKVYVQGKSLGVQKVNALYCTGHYNLATHTTHPCAEQVVLNPQHPSSSCKACYKKTGFYPAFDTIAREKLSDQQQVYNQDVHHVYLAYFAPGIIKVGMAHHTRYDSRLLEQGARAGCRVQSFQDAYQARAFEKKAVQCGLKERISKQKKMDLLTKFPYSVAQGKRGLQSVLQHLYEKVDTTIHLSSAITSFQSVYFPHGQPCSLTSCYWQEGRVEGQVQGMIGSILVLYNGLRNVSLDMYPWLGSVLIQCF